VLFVADSGNSLIQAFLPDGSVLWEFGGVGTNPGTFKQARDVSVGIGGRVYVADTVNNRIQVVDVSAGPAIGSLGVFGVQGSLAGQFRVPQGVAPALNDGSVYVADTYNNRVQKLRLTFDGDGDGMDDVWEDLHGLDSHDPLDAFADPDGDGVINIGEYRLGTDPQNSDSNGNGESDGWELAHGVDPLAVTLEIARFTAWPALISWVGVEGGVYEIQTTTNLVPNIWGSEGGVTSPVAGYLTWTNSGPQTNSVKFYRVKWMNVP
jgi:DNA-binding beta-propeller fold protein YncE